MINNIIKFIGNTEWLNIQIYQSICITILTIPLSKKISSFYAYPTFTLFHLNLQSDYFNITLFGLELYVIKTPNDKWNLCLAFLERNKWCSKRK